ncbi:MAG TPA: hypothetical protein VFZ40_05595 [Pyrinomonadaceae bacterium]
MRKIFQFSPFGLCVLSLSLWWTGVVVGAPHAARGDAGRELDWTRLAASMSTANPAESESAPNFEWNIKDKELPLLTLDEERLPAKLDQLLTYPIDQFRVLVFQFLRRDDARGRYQLQAISNVSKEVHFIEFESMGDGKTFLAIDGSGLELIDQGTLKIIRAGGGAKLLFIEYPDGEFRCASIKHANGANLNFLYAANGLALRGVVDSFGRTIRINYDATGIESVTQTWMATATGRTKTWHVGNAPENTPTELARYSHGFGSKVIPGNALVREYSAAMAGSDKNLAEVFSGLHAVAAGNGFEPAGLGTPYPLYRGDITGDDGKPRRGHLSSAIHIYGSADGTGDSPLYVPAGFTSHSGVPSPKDAVVTFYYHRLGNFTDITLAVFHVADFQIAHEGDRIRIGNIGGSGGSSKFYKHSHIEFYKGNTALPPAGSRSALRIDPSTIFSASR